MRAGIYTRISQDSRDPDEERGLGVERQREDCEEYAIQRDYEIAGTFTDNDTSASTLSRKARPGYEQLLDAVRAGKIGVIIAYSNSRLTRRPRELEDLIHLHEQTGVRIETVVSGSDDLSTADGRMTARIKASVDAAEAERTGERIRRQKEQRALQGKPQGGRYRVFGYSRDWKIIEQEAAALREVVKRRIDGQSMTSLARLLDDQGQRTSSGARWTSGTLAGLLANPTIAGLRPYRGAVAGPSQVPAIVTEADWLRANSIVTKRQPGTNARRWLLSGILRCGRCQGGMIGNGDRGGYRCNKAWNGCGNTTCQTLGTDSAIVSMVLAREGGAVPVKVDSPDNMSQELAQVNADIGVAHAAFKDGGMAMADYVHAMSVLRERKASIEKTVADERPPIGGLIVTLGDWIAADLSARRALIGRHVDYVQVLAANRGGNRIGPRAFDVRRLVIHWIDGSVEQLSEELLAGVPRWNGSDGWSVPKGTPIARLGPVQVEGPPHLPG